MNDEDDNIRLKVAKQGYGLDKLVNDNDPLVRVEAAKALMKLNGRLKR